MECGLVWHNVCNMVSMMSRSAVLAIALGVLPLTACATEEPEIGASVDDVREKDIDFQVWEAPLELTLDGAAEATIAYGECESVEPTDDNVDIQINCGRAWSEVAWYVVPAETIQQLVPTGMLSVELSIPGDGGVLRSSIHRVTDDGKVKLASRSTLFDGDRIEAPIEEIADHYVYVARGRTLINVWGTGEMAFSAALTPSGI
jgi:hypothetical protein